MSQATIVTCGIIQLEDMILAGKRADNGLWELPGGKKREDESLEECLARELAEELGVAVEVGEPFQVVEEDGLQLHSFFCRLKRDRPRPCVHKELRWLTPSRFGQLELCGPDRVLAQALQERQHPGGTTKTGDRQT